MKPSPFTDTATFKDAKVGGEKQITARYNWKQGVCGIVCIFAAVMFFAWGVVAAGADILLLLLLIGVGLVLLVVGIALLATASTTRKQVVEVRMEGEAYKASATVLEGAQETDVVADVRVIVAVNIASFAGSTKVEEKVRDTDRRIIDEDFAELQRRIETVLPSFMMR